MTAPFRRLIAGLDTVQAAYYLRPHRDALFSFAALMVVKERLRADKARGGELVGIGDSGFLVHPYGSRSGYPLVLAHRDFTMECGEFNNPAFFVTYRSRALREKGAAALHAAFLEWAQSVGFWIVKPEALSRVDFAFDYWLPGPDFDADCIVSLSAKDAQYRGDRRVQTIQYGKADILLRIYNKALEILEQSEKFWLYQLWNETENVWRIEWQIRKDILKRFGLRTFADLFDGYGDVLRWLSDEHDSLRVPTADSNRSRWSLHPLWTDLIAQIQNFPCQGVYSALDDAAAINARLARIGVSLYGYWKRVGALVSLRDQRVSVTFAEAAEAVESLVARAHEPATWVTDVAAKRLQCEFPGN